MMKVTLLESLKKSIRISWAGHMWISKGLITQREQPKERWTKYKKI